jgi:DNA topoisomerase-1
MKLLIVDSPGKLKQLKSFLDPDWEVFSFPGPVREFPNFCVGAFPPDYVPTYEIVPAAQEVLPWLTALVERAESVYLGTDPDLEGEALAWHVQEILQLTDPRRVCFGQLTEEVVRQSLAAYRSVDLNLVRAEECRRLLDRLIDQNVSPVLKSVSHKNLSAGRLHSSALKMVVDRERKVRSFDPMSYFELDCHLSSPDDPAFAWKVSWNPANWTPAGLGHFPDLRTVRRLAGIPALTVDSVFEGQSRLGPAAPFVTSTLIQAASNALKMDSVKAMTLARKLYEQGHITYLLTSNPNICPQAVEEIRRFASAADWPLSASVREFGLFGGDHPGCDRPGCDRPGCDCSDCDCPGRGRPGCDHPVCDLQHSDRLAPPAFAPSRTASEEAIRPTRIDVESAGQNNAERALYRLIRLRTLASQLEDAVYATSLTVLSGELNGQKAYFEAESRRLVKTGWKILVKKDQAADDSAEDEFDGLDNPAPVLAVGAVLKIVKSEVRLKRTETPARHTAASLLRDLQAWGIGRPSTYSRVLENLVQNGFVSRNRRRQLQATDLGEELIDQLAAEFSFHDYPFCRALERQIDEVAEGRRDCASVLRAASLTLDKELKTFVVKTGVLGCPFDKSFKAKENGDRRYLEILASLTFNEAFGSPREWDRPGETNGLLGSTGLLREKEEATEHKCPVCGHPLLRKRGLVGDSKLIFDFFCCSSPKCGRTYSAGGDKPNLFQGQEALLSWLRTNNKTLH